MKKHPGLLTLLSIVLLGCTLTALRMAGTPAAAAGALITVEAPPAVPVSSPGAAGTTYYVRTDGGSTTQCTGRVNAPYPGSGTGQPCAWNHPFQALPPGDPPRIAGGDTLVIASGSYMMGYGAPGADNCDSAFPWDCYVPPIPSGPGPQTPTRILGAGWNTGCASPPELWGTKRPWFVVNLTGSSNVELACLEITDHSPCIEDHNQSGLPCTGCNVPCERNEYPYGDWASVGIYAEDSASVHLADLNVHGLASRGIQAGRLTNWTVERVRIVANGSAGWDGDLGGGTNSNNSGDLIFRQVEVAYNGCSESWPGEAITLNTCWGQEAGGYGDGFAAGSSGGRWVLEDCYVHHNTSDGIDLLYLKGNSAVEIRRLISAGNAGNQLKTAGPAVVENALLIGNCAYFEGQPLMLEGDQCRAMGNSISVDLHRGSTVIVTNSSITGQGDCLADTGCNDSLPDDSDPDCNGSETVTIRNTLLAGNTDWRQPWEQTCLYWYDDTLLPSDPVSFDYNLVWQAKDNPCPGTHHVCGQNPLLRNSTLASFDGYLLAGSPAIDAGSNAFCPATDIAGTTRPVDGDGNGNAVCDIGAYERWMPTAWVYLPVTLKQ